MTNLLFFPRYQISDNYNKLYVLCHLKIIKIFITKTEKTHIKYNLIFMKRINRASKKTKCFK